MDGIGRETSTTERRDKEDELQGVHLGETVWRLGALLRPGLR